MLHLFQFAESVKNVPYYMKFWLSQRISSKTRQIKMHRNLVPLNIDCL